MNDATDYEDMPQHVVNFIRSDPRGFMQQYKEKVVEPTCRELGKAMFWAGLICGFIAGIALSAAIAYFVFVRG